jgi:DNA-binding transcriptional regulator YiaG
MSKAYIYVSIAAALVFISLAFDYYSRGKTIDILNAQLNASVQSKALCEQKNNIYVREIALQNSAIEQIKLDNEKAFKELLNTHKNSVKKWEKEIKTLKNATCEQQLKQIDELHKAFYKERE